MSRLLYMQTQSAKKTEGYITLGEANIYIYILRRDQFNNDICYSDAVGNKTQFVDNLLRIKTINIGSMQCIQIVFITIWRSNERCW